MIIPNQVQEMSTEITLFLRQTNCSLQPSFMANTVLLGLVSLSKLSFLSYKMFVYVFTREVRNVSGLLKRLK